MKRPTDYHINLKIKHGPSQLIDIPVLVRRCRKRWFNQTLCRVNDCVVRLGILHGEFHWHKHEREDEFFFVLRGRLLVDLKGRTVVLKKHQGFTVPRKVLHRTRAPRRTVVLMVEAATVKPVGDKNKSRHPAIK
jgi:mannose-6-phosphate isomerase-like protein (cupin superfamily)